MDHSDDKYQCKMSDCPYTGTTVTNKIKRPWGEVGWVWSPQEADQEGGGMMEVRYDVVRDRYVWRWENILRRVEVKVRDDRVRVESTVIECGVVTLWGRHQSDSQSWH